MTGHPRHCQSSFVFETLGHRGHSRLSPVEYLLLCPVNIKPKLLMHQIWAWTLLGSPREPLLSTKTHTLQGTHPALAPLQKGNSPHSDCCTTSPPPHSIFLPGPPCSVPAQPWPLTQDLSTAEERPQDLEVGRDRPLRVESRPCHCSSLEN